jgi:hypothetical protein
MRPTDGRHCSNIAKGPDDTWPSGRRLADHVALGIGLLSRDGRIEFATRRGDPIEHDRHVLSG